MKGHIKIIVEETDESGENYDGYVDISVQEREAFLKCEQEFWKWQELLGKRYKKA